MGEKPLEYDVSRMTLDISLWSARMSTQRSEDTIKVIKCLEIYQELVSVNISPHICSRLTFCKLHPI